MVFVLKIYQSGKKRAEQTAGIIAAALGLPSQRGRDSTRTTISGDWVERISAEAEDLMIVGLSAVPGEACLLCLW